MHRLMQRRRDRRRAGRSGLELHRHEAAQWRRERRRVFWPLSGLVAVVVAVSLVVGLLDGHVVSWIAGAVAGTALCFLVVARESGPAWIENRRVGAWAEQRTAKVLAGLTRRGWVVLHDLPSDHGNLDHVVIGPSGVFVLDTKQRTGEIAVEGDDLLIASPSGGRPRREEGRGRNARGQGRELQRRLCQAGAQRLWVSAVVVLWGEFPAHVVVGDRVTFVAGEAVAEWIEAQPARYTRAQIDVLAGVARTLLFPAARSREVPHARTA